MHRPVASLCLSAGLAMAASAADAQSPLDRLETLDEQMNEIVFDAFVTQIPALTGYMPSLEWDEAMRENGACLLDAVEAQAGADGVARLLESYAAAVAEAEANPTELSAIRLEPPEGMSGEEFQAAYSECGMLDWLYTRLADSGALAIIMESGQ